MALADFRLGALLGSGTSGRVLRAVHQDSQIPVALKTIRPTGRLDALSLERELAALARLDHPAILHLYDHGVAESGSALDAGTHWMALEFAGGGSLEDRAPTDWAQAEGWLKAVLSGLSHAHARGLIHRDLKPANLVICASSDVRPGLKIADFGLAWVVHQDKKGLVRAGSPSYMPPEQCRGEAEALGPWSDLYALACVGWEWATGEPPFGWGEVGAVIDAQLHDAVGPFRARYEVPDGLEALLRALLAKDWTARPPTASHVSRTLDRLGRVRRVRIRTGLLPVPARWRQGDSAPSTAVLTGAGLGLFELRDPPLVGRDAAQDALWTAVRRVANDGRTEVVALTGTRGVGCGRTARWLAERVAELGCATVAAVDPTAEVPSLAALQALPGPVIALLHGQAGRPEVAELSRAALLEPNAPLLIVLSGPPEAPLFTDLDRLPGFERVHLDPLSPQVLADFLCSHMGLARGIAETVAQQAGGNVGLAVAWLRGWVRSGGLISGPEGFQPAADLDLTAAPSLDAARRAQLDAALATLDDPGRLALALGALLGTEVKIAEWLPLLQRFGLDLRNSPVRRLSRATLVASEAAGWRILDPAVRLALIDELDRHGERPAFHLAAAHTLAKLTPSSGRSERRGRHLLAAGEREQGRAVLTEAVDALRAEGQWTAVRAVVELLAKQANVDAMTPDQRFVVYYYGALASANLLSPREAAPLARKVVALAPQLNEARAARSYRLAAEVFALASLNDEAQAALAHTDLTLPRMRRIRAMLAIELGDLEGGLAQYLALWEDTTGHDRSLAANGIGRAYALGGDHARAEHWFQACLDTGERSLGFVPLCNIAIVRLLSGSPAQAVPMVQRAVEAARDETVSHRGYVATITCLVAAAAGERALLEEHSQRALYHAYRPNREESDTTLNAIARAKTTASGSAVAFLDLLESRVRTVTFPQ